MDADQFNVLMGCLGFGFGSLFWLFFFWLVFKAK